MPAHGSRGATHKKRSAKTVRLMDAAMVPLSWLLLKSLQRNASAPKLNMVQGEQRTRTAESSGCRLTRGWCQSADCQGETYGARLQRPPAHGSRRATHKKYRLVRLPVDAGMVPIRLLLLSSLGHKASAPSLHTAQGGQRTVPQPGHSNKQPHGTSSSRWPCLGL